MKSTDFLTMPTDPIRAALERLISAYDEHGGRWPDHHVDALHNAVKRARADLAAEPAAPLAAEAQREAVMQAVAKALGNTYDCLRVWEAWSFGTMGPDDFALVAEDDTRLAEIADAAIQAMRPVVEKEAKQLRLLFDKTRHQMADSLGVDRGCGWTSLAMEARNLRSAATPAADWVEPSDEQLIDAWNENSEYYALHAEACDFARDVLTRWGRPAAPAALVDGEVGKLVAWLNDHAAHLRTMEGIGALPETELQERLDRAATLLQQQAAELAALRAPQGGEVDPPAAGQRQALSPAAQAVLDAVTAELDWDARYHSHSAAAAAIRALADHAGSSKHWHADDLRTIAAELERADG